MNKRIPGFIHIAESLHLARTRWRKGGATLQDLLRLRVDWKRKLWQRRERDALLERRQVRKRAAMEGKCSAAVNKEEEFLRSLGRYRIEEYLAPSPFGEHIGIRVVFEKPGREKEVIRDLGTVPRSLKEAYKEKWILADDLVHNLTLLLRHKAGVPRQFYDWYLVHCLDPEVMVQIIEAWPGGWAQWVKDAHASVVWQDEEVTMYKAHTSAGCVRVARVQPRFPLWAPPPVRWVPILGASATEKEFLVAGKPDSVA